MKNSCSKHYFVFGLILFFTTCFLLNAGCRENKPERKPFAQVTTFAGLSEKFGEPFGIAVRGVEIFVSDGEKGAIWKISRDGAMQIFTDKLNTPSQIAFDKNGDLIVADSGSHTIKRVKQTGEIEISLLLSEQIL